MFGKSRTEKSAPERSARVNGAANGAASQKPVNRAEHGGVEGHPAAFAARLTEAERRELRAQIEEGLRALSPEHRQVLVLREMHQLSYDEIADTLDLDVGTVKSRISRGRKQLRNFLLTKGNFLAAPPSKGAGKEGCK